MQPNNVRTAFRPPAVELSELPCWNPLESCNYNPKRELTLDLSEMSDLGKECRSMCETYGYTPSAQHGLPVHGREVGDDRVDLSRDPFKLAVGLVVQERVLGMKTSWEDTFISDSIWNFCEVSNGIPTAPEQGFDFCRKANGFNNLGFVDVPPLRIIMDATKSDRSHSSTVPGKASMLGGRMRTPRDEFLQDFHLASYLQDGYLRTCRSTEPKYLPQIMGGSGVRALFNSPENLYLSVHAYRSGKCQRVYGTATRELQECLALLERDQASMPVLCLRLRDKQEYLHGTYSNKVFIPTEAWKDSVKGNLPTPLITAGGGANWFTNFENRLVRTKHVVTRTSAVREWEFTLRIREQLRGWLPIKQSDEILKANKARGRSEFDMALCANTAFANLLDRDATIKDVAALTNDKNFVTVNTGVTSFSRWDAEWLFSGGKSERFSIEDLTSSEDLYLRSEVSEEETFKVGNIPLRPIHSSGTKRVETTTKVGLYQINQSMYEWASNLTNRLVEAREEGKSLPPHVAHRVFSEDPEWVNDDTSIIGRCLHDTRTLSMKSARVVLVSMDKRLANQLSNTCNVQVDRLHPGAFILWALREGVDPMSQDIDPQLLEPLIDQRNRGDPIRHVYVDTGSVSAVMATLQEIDEGAHREIFVRDLIETGRDDHGHRFVRYSLREIPEENRKFRTLPVRPTLRPKKYLHKSSDTSVPYYRPRSHYGSSSRRSETSSNWRRSQLS